MFDFLCAFLVLAPSYVTYVLISVCLFVCLFVRLCFVLSAERKSTASSVNLKTAFVLCGSKSSSVTQTSWCIPTHTYILTASLLTLCVSVCACVSCVCCLVSPRQALQQAVKREQDAVATETAAHQTTRRALQDKETELQSVRMQLGKLSVRVCVCVCVCVCVF